jgi:DNA-binding SARP family transcriptional activator
MSSWGTYNDEKQSRAETISWILHGRGIVGIEAPSGYGKSQLLASLADGWPGPVMWVTIKTKLGKPVSADTLVLADDLSHASNEAETVLSFVHKHAERNGLGVIAARVLPSMFSARSSVPRLLVTDRYLHNTVADIANLLEDRVAPEQASQLANVIATNAGNWPEYERSLVDSVGPDPMRSLLRVIDSFAAVSRIVDQFNQLDAEDLAALVQVSHFPICTDRCFEALRPGTDFLRRVRVSGYPVRVRLDGVVECNPVLRRWLRSLGSLDKDAARQVYPALAGAGDVLVCVRLMLAVGDFVPAISLVGELSASTVEWLPPDELLAVLETIHTITDADTDPRLSLQLARTYTNLGRLADAHREFSRAAVLAETSDLSPMSKAEIRAEMLSELAFRDGELLRHDVESMLVSVPPSWVIARSSLAVAYVALAARNTSDHEEIAKAETLLLGSVSALEAIGESLRAARALRVLAATLISGQFRFREACALINRCKALVQGRTRHYVSNLAVGCMFAAMLGDLETFDTYEHDLNAVLESSETGWEKAYLNWARMICAAWRGDHDATVLFRRTAEQQLGQILSQPTGVTFYSLCADSLARVDDKQRSYETLNLAIERRHESEPEVRFAELVVAARFEAPQNAISIGEQLLADRLTPQAKRWRIIAELALAHARNGNLNQARNLCELAQLEATACGDVIQDHHFHPAVRVLRDRPETASSAETLRIQLLGSFEVFRDGIRIDIPPGHVETLIKFIATRNGTAPVEVLTDLLWPDAELEVARRRLKNVLLRVRNLLGEKWVSRTPTAVVLHPDVNVDLTDFERTARRAHVLSVTHDNEAIGVCLDALAKIGGTMLPNDLYSDWAETARVTLRSRALALIAIALKAPLEMPVATRLLDSLLRVDAEGLDQLIAVARRADLENDKTTLRAAALQAHALAESTGFASTPAMRELFVKIGL